MNLALTEKRKAPFLSPKGNGNFTDWVRVRHYHLSFANRSGNWIRCVWCFVNHRVNCTDLTQPAILWSLHSWDLRRRLWLFQVMISKPVVKKQAPCLEIVRHPFVVSVVLVWAWSTKAFEHVLNVEHARSPIETSALLNRLLSFRCFYLGSACTWKTSAERSIFVLNVKKSEIHPSWFDIKQR